MPIIIVKHENGEVSELKISPEAADVIAIEVATQKMRAALNPGLEVSKEIDKELMSFAKCLGGLKRGNERV